MKLTRIEPGAVWTEGMLDMELDLEALELVTKFSGLTAEQLSNMELMLQPEDVGEMVASVLSHPDRVYIHTLVAQESLAVY